MMPLFLFASGALVALGLAAVWFDLTERRIPNALTVPALAVILLARSAAGVPELGAGILGAGICFLVAVPFFAVGGLGGGDVKLLAAFGGFLGPERIPAALLVTALVGGGLAVVQVARRRAFRRTLWNLWWIVRSLRPRAFRGWRGEPGNGVVTLRSPGAIAVPYGVAISAGALFGWFVG